MKNNLIIVWIALGVFIWGTIHAIGAYVNFRSQNPWRAVMVMLCVDGFLAFWLLLLWWRKSRQE